MPSEREFMHLFVLFLLLFHLLFLEVEESLEVVWRELAADLHLQFLFNLPKAV